MSAATGWRIRARRGGLEPETGAKGLRLTGEREWLLTGSAEILDGVMEAIPGHAERFGADALLLAFGNAVGRIELPEIGSVEIVSGKWDEDTFDQMLRDLVRICGSLPFSTGEGPLLSFELAREAGRMIDYHAFLYLRQILSAEVPHEERLVPAIELILRDPHRRWRRTTRSVPLDRVQRASGGTLQSLLAGHRQAPAAHLSGAATSLASRLGGALPHEVWEERVRSEVDTPENRFVRRFLDEAHGTVSRVARHAAVGTGAFHRRVAAEAECAGLVLDRLRRAPLWQEVGELQHLPAASTVLHGRRGYRHVFRHWVRLRRNARLPLSDDDAIALVEAKDIALLYELWCYFQVVDVMTEVLGAPTRAVTITRSQWETHLPEGHRVEWPRVRLRYNGRFSKGGRGAGHAYSTPLRPDIVLEDRRSGHPIVHLLDAKFRIERRVRAHGPLLDFKRVDLYKMHAYRDAIPAGRSARVLYPGDVEAWFPLPGGDPDLDGVGAIPLMPGGDGSGVRAWVRRVVGG